MRISDWSSDVCSYDLDPLPRPRPVPSVPLERISDRRGQASRLCGRGRPRAGVPSRIVSSVRRKRMKTVLVASSKGGVGKTTIAPHPAAHPALSGQHTVLVDADPPGSCTCWAERCAGLESAVLPTPISDERHFGDWWILTVRYRCFTVP